MVGETLKKLFRPRHDYLPGVQVFSPIDAERIKSEMKLAERGKADGEKDIPGADATSPAAAELEIVRKCENWRGSALAEARQTLEVYTQRLTAGSQGLELAQLRTMADEASTDLTQVAEDEIALLAQPRLEVQRRTNDFDAFRDQQKIRRAPRLPAGFWKTAMIISIVALIEVAGNSFFFAEAGNDFGILGAVIEAVVIPIANVGVATLLVFFGVRQLWRREILRKLIGLLSLAAFVAFAIGFNLAVAHFRDALAVVEHKDAATHALGTLVAGPFDLQSLISWLLFGLGAMVTVVTFYEVITYRDQIPGYWPLEQTRLDALDDFNDDRQAAIANIKAAFNERRDRLLTVRQRLAQAISDAALMAERVQHLGKDLDEYGNYLSLTSQELAEAYREQNRAARKAPAPPHFAKTLWVPEAMLLDLTASSVFERELKQLSGLKEGEDILESGLKQLNDALARDVKRIDVLGTFENLEPKR